MNTTLIFAFLIGAFAVFLFIIRQWFNRLEEKTRSSTDIVGLLQDVSRRIDMTNATVDQKLSRNMDMFNNRLDNAARVIGDVQKSIGQFSEIGRSMQQLQQFLQSPKLRGNIGEQVLKDLLAQNFPPNTYKLQFPFKSGEKVDAALVTSQGIIPIDSKFPSENFRKMIDCPESNEKIKIRKLFIADVKKHIGDIAKKYILPAEGTVDYALMYVPAESVYYEIVNEPLLTAFANDSRVLPVSPLTFYAYMKAILMSFEGQRIQNQAKEILSVLTAIKKDFEKSDIERSVLQKHITNAFNQMNDFSRSFTSLGQKLDSTRLIGAAETAEKLLE